MNLSTIVEEADIGLCADGFDNFLLYGDLEELTEYRKALKKIGAKECFRVIDELLHWVTSDTSKTPLEITEDNPEKTKALWKSYNESSCAEEPIELAKKVDPPKRKHKLPITDRDYYDFFGEENPSKPCRKEECSRGTVSGSVFCKPHHFENVMRKPCPWED